MADYKNHTIRKITPGGEVSTLAGQPGISGSADGIGSAARFFWPRGIATDAAGNVYVAEVENHTIRKITPAGVVTTLAGRARSFGSADGMGGAAQFNGPSSVATDAVGRVYVADTVNHTIRLITPAGEVSTLAGLAGNPGNADGEAGAARFNHPTGVTIDKAGSVFVADFSNSTIRKITPSGVVTTVAGSVQTEGSDDGTGSAARFNGPVSVATDAADHIYVADSNNHGIRKGFMPPPQLSSFHATGNHSLVFQVSGQLGRACVIEMSIDINSTTAWLPIHSNTVPFWFTNFNVGPDSRRFYRAVLKPPLQGIGFAH